MDAESDRATAGGQPDSAADGSTGAHGASEEVAADSASESSTLPARRFTSAGNRLQATLAAADSAAEDILEGARAEARELIQRAEQVATDRTAQLHTQVEILLTQANDLTQRAQQLSEATRELTSSVNRVVSVEAPAVTELELGGGEVEPLIARPLPPATIGAGTPPAEAEHPITAEEAVVESPPAEAEEPPAEVAPPADDEQAETTPGDNAETETEADVDTAEPPAAEAPPAPQTQPANAQQPETPTISGPPPSQPPPASMPEPAEPAAAAPEEPDETSDEPAKASRPRRSLFSRLRRGSHAEEEVEVQRFAERPRASADAIAEVSPGHQMLARQMLLDGLSEEEIERRLRDEFRVRDPGAVLDSLQLSGPPITPAKDEASE
jgi:hypothetical protein